MSADRSSSPPTAPDRDRRRGGVALLIIDMINRFDFAGAEALRPRAVSAAEAIRGLRAAFRAADRPVIYVNDNFGEWHSEKSVLVENARVGGNELVERLAPEPEDYFIIKPQFSGFYATNLPVLLPKLGVSRLILTGIATDACVLVTAADAHMRDYAIWVPEDAVAASDERGARALEIMRRSLNAETAPTAKLRVETWLNRLDSTGIR